MFLKKWKKMIYAVAMLLILVSAFVLPCAKVSAKTQSDMPILSVPSDFTLPQKALSGSSITLPTVTAVYSDNTPVDEKNIIIRVSKGNEVITHADKTYKLDSKGIYTVYFEVTDPSNNLSDFKSYSIDVRDEWLSIALSGENKQTSLVGMPLTLEKAKVVGLNGEDTGIIAKISIKFGNITTLLSEPSFTPQAVGDYTIVYSAEKNGETVTLQSSLKVSGIRPTITVRNIPNIITVGEQISLPHAEAFNDDGNEITAVDIKITAKIGDEIIDIKNYAFMPNKVGKYTITYTAINKYGIPNTYFVELECVKKSHTTALIISLCVIGGVLILAGGVVIVYFYRKRKNNKTINNTNMANDIEEVKIDKSQISNNIEGEQDEKNN